MLSLSPLPLLALLGVVLPAVAGAAPRDADPDTEIARRHFVKGSNSYDQEDYLDAIEEFSAAQRVWPLPAFDYNIGRCHDRLEHFAEAISHYEAYLAAERDAADAIPLRARIGLLRQRLIDEHARTTGSRVGSSICLSGC